VGGCGAHKYYTNVVNICARYEHKMSNTAKLKYLAKKCQSTTYAPSVNAQLKSSSPSFEKACNEIAEIERLVNSTNKLAERKTGKEGSISVFMTCKE
jgi:hypothetical protein